MHRGAQDYRLQPLSSAPLPSLEAADLEQIEVRTARQVTHLHYRVRSS
jgi:hypothetical protein